MTIYKINNVIGFIIFTLLLVSCSESEYNENEIASLKGRYLKASQNAISIEAAKGSTGTSYIECMKNSWTVTGVPAWLSASPMQSSNSEDIVIIATEENYSADQIRTALLAVQSAESDWSYSIPVTVTQGKNSPIIISEVGELTLPYEKQECVIPIESNCKWDITTSGEVWLNAEQSKDEKSINVTVDQNYSGDSRVAYIYVKAADYDCSAVVRVIQGVSNITATTDQIEVENKGGDFTLNINSETSWTASCSQTWGSISPDSGNKGVTTLHISVSPSAQKWRRTAYLYINVGSSQRIEIPIVQEKSYLDVSKSNISLPSKGGTVDVTISANAPWTINVPSNATWLTSSVTSGTNEGSTIITVYDNPSANNRSAQISVNTEYGMLYNIDVNQDARYLHVSSSSIFFNKKGGQGEPIMIETDGSYSVSNPLDWVSITENKSNNTIVISCSQNETGTFREGYIDIELTDLKDGSKLTKSIKVFQTGSDSSSFFINRFEGEDKDWNFYNDANISISVTGFSSTDSNWTPK